MSSHWGQIPDKVVRNNRGAGALYNGKGISAKMRELTDRATGKSYEVPDDDYRQYLGRKQDQSVEDYISSVFGPKSDIKTVDVRATGGDTGHITKLEYAVLYKMLRVTFRKPSRKGQVVVYMNVPTPVAGELLYLAEYNPTQMSGSTFRHVLGIRFWDLIRIRGTVHGTRYTFKYTNSTADGSDNYVKGTATPDWGKTDFVLVNNSNDSRLTAKPVNQLTDVERKQMEDRVALIQQDIQSGDIPSVDYMFRRLDKANIEPKAKEYIRGQMESMKNGKDAARTLYNYLGVMGLL